MMMTSRKSVIFACLMSIHSFWSAISRPFFSMPFFSYRDQLSDKSRKGTFRNVFFDMLGSMKEEIRFRKMSLDQYRDQIIDKVVAHIEKFGRDQDLLRSDAKMQLESYTLKINQLYNETLLSLQRQQKSIAEFQESEAKQFVRPKRIDESLEEFRLSFNESDFLNGLITNHWRPAWDKQKKQLQDFSNLDPFGTQIDNLTNNLKKNWNFLLQLSSEGSKNADLIVQKTMEDLVRLQDELKTSSKLIEKAAQDLFPGTLSKEDIRLKTGNIESQLRKLEHDGSLWVAERFKQLDSAVRTLQEKLQASESVYDELIGRKKAAVHYSLMNDIVLNKVLNLIDQNDPGWELIRSDGDINVYRKFIRGGETFGSQYACVKCSGIIHASPESILTLFEDNTRVREYNTFFDRGRDLETVAENTKVVWACSPPIFPFKARDFCTVVHFRKLKDGTVVVLNRATTHEEAPVSNDFVRAAIVLAANIIQPVPGNPNACKLTMITQLDPGGFAPPVIVNNVCTIGPISFMRLIESAAKRTPSHQVIMEKKKLAAEGKGGLKLTTHKS
mmetsp:Transcript_9735/g.13308  ORF Transcript_9735/g.13308 Transcript_9735/m.13308 type:complete len:557 (-) Transcript_9735:40-1710(-)